MTKGGKATKRLIIAATAVAFGMGGAVAQAPGTCDSKAIDKNGKTLAGAAKKSLCKNASGRPVEQLISIRWVRPSSSHIVPLARGT
jgi:hypothetical protein